MKLHLLLVSLVYTTYRTEENESGLFDPAEDAHPESLKTVTEVSKVSPASASISDSTTKCFSYGSKAKKFSLLNMFRVSSVKSCWS